MSIFRRIVTCVFIFFPLWTSPSGAVLVTNTAVLNAARGDSFVFSEGTVNPFGKADIALISTDDGKIVFFRSGRIRDMGKVPLEMVTNAPPSGYTEGSQLLDGHTYCLITEESRYVKFHVSRSINNSLQYRLQWVFQSDGSRALKPMSSSSVTPSTWGKIKVIFR